jgi:hypothetical protein
MNIFTCKDTWPTQTFLKDHAPWFNYRIFLGQRCKNVMFQDIILHRILNRASFLDSTAVKRTYALCPSVLTGQASDITGRASNSPSWFGASKKLSVLHTSEELMPGTVLTSSLKRWVQIWFLQPDIETEITYYLFMTYFNIFLAPVSIF